MGLIQNPEQSGFTKGKECIEASRTVLDMVQNAKCNGLPLLVPSTDFSKAVIVLHLTILKKV